MDEKLANDNVDSFIERIKSLQNTALSNACRETNNISIENTGDMTNCVSNTVSYYKHPCPTCNRCPTCGKGGYYNSYWYTQPPYYSWMNTTTAYQPVTKTVEYN